MTAIGSGQQTNGDQLQAVAAPDIAPPDETLAESAAQQVQNSDAESALPEIDEEEVLRRGQAYLEAGQRAYRQRIDDAKERIQARARVNRMRRLGQYGGIYRVEEGDTLAQIAELAYGDVEAWTRIYEANREQIADPATLAVGVVLQIPKGVG